MNIKITSLLFIIICFLVSSAFADGTLIGVVSDSLSGFDLPGANIQISGTAMGASTDLNGEYRISSIPAGSYEVIVSYIGYQTRSVNMEIADGETKVLSVTLFPEAIEGEVIVVTAQARGQQQAINQQLASDKIANIVSEQRIQELPDFNAAAALSRLPGISTTKSSGEDNKVVIRGLSPKYNSIEVEGVKLSATGSSSIGLTSDVYVATGGVQNDRSVDLTMVSPYMIRTIAVYKSLTPDMNANSIGGTVNMELREAPTGLKWDFMWQQGYTAKSNTIGNYRVVASGSNRFFNEKLGMYALVNAESYDRDADNLNAGWGTKAGESLADSITGYRIVQVNSVRFNRHMETRKRYGANLILDYQLPKGSIKLVNLFTQLNSDYTNYDQTINYNSGRLEWRVGLGENIINQQMHSLKLDYKLGILTADISASYTAAKNELEDSPVFNFNQVSGVFIEDRDNMIPEDLSYLVDYLGNDNVILRSGNLFSNYYKEDKYTYKADFELPYSFGKAVSGSFKFGGLIQNQSNSTDQEAPYLGFDGSALPTSSSGIANDLMRAVQTEFDLSYSSAGELTGTSLLNRDKDTFDPFLEDDYGDIYYASNPDLLEDILNYIIDNPAFDASDPTLSNGRQGGWYDGPYQQYTNDYEYDEDYYASYAMTKINFLDFMVLGGARYEKVKSDYFAYNARDLRNAQLQKMYDTTSVNENEFVLPMGQIKYSPFDWMDVRYAYTQTLSRPDYQQLSPKFTITQGNNIYAGNPDLKPAKSYNHDLSFTFHANKLGLFTIGGFYKTVENFVYGAGYRLDAATNAGIDSISRYQIVRDGVMVVNPVNTDATVYRPLNNPNDAIIKGLEVDFQHNFWYMPRPFNNMVFGINYARVFSKTRYPWYGVEVQIIGRDRIAALIDSSSSGRLINQPNHVLNSYLGYDYKGFSARVSIVFQDNSARSAVGEYPENRSFTEEYFRVDFSARQQLPFFHSELFLDIANLNNEKTSWVQKSVGGYVGIQNYGLTANLGIRIRY